MFKQRIQLPNEERSRWAIPCCSSFRGRGGIQLPDDSDQEEEDITPFHINSTANFLQHPANLSRNPFARAEEMPTKTVLPVELPAEVNKLIFFFFGGGTENFIYFQLLGYRGGAIKSAQEV